MRARTLTVSAAAIAALAIPTTPARADTTCPTDRQYAWGTCTPPNGVRPAPAGIVQAGAPTRICTAGGQHYECPAGMPDPPPDAIIQPPPPPPHGPAHIRRVRRLRRARQ
jgi:hypothetical protein